ncbi:prephenate dehydrogenase [Lichenifustis flavocetrariae]|uniref:Prephenate dehydrogenase n=1 Tax=Lichenifustis flavocetrariae TaxID=2949735 RepID=A0AA41YZT5_9HYPH|nr:prephenate dehydrogenase [Lichenifustis flavocetrariae]MCW6506702.1 prephenate dehydrogenase [Lichenifustis flavocetrariae]
MLSTITIKNRVSIGIVGFGAFGRLMARHLAPFFALRAYDPRLSAGGAGDISPVVSCTLREVAQCGIVIIATPAAAIESVVKALAPHLRPATLVLDVGSVKVAPAEIMRRHLPEHVDIVATHPLFGPESAKNGIRGLKIAVCPLRGRRGPEVGAFLKKCLGLDVLFAAAEDHDSEVAFVQGLTHVIGRLLGDFELSPMRFTTRSFELLLEATDLVRHDAPEVVDAILGANPYVQEVRQQFFRAASRLEAELTQRHRGGAFSRDRAAAEHDTPPSEPAR